jgi:hypothetical protein
MPPEAKKHAVSTARLTVAPEHLAVIDKAETKVGGKVRLVIYGTLRSYEKAQTDLSEEGSQAGSLEVAVSSVKYSSNNEIADLFDEEFDA